MILGLSLLLLALLVIASGVYSGSEIGFYSVSPVRIDLEARQGHRMAQLAGRLLRDDSALLVTILIGNNLVVELATHVGDSLFDLSFAPAGWREVLIALLLTPLLFFFGEALPKELFRRRPYALLRYTAPLIEASRLLFWPLAQLLTLVTRTLERSLGLDSAAVTQLAGREAVLLFLAEGTRAGALSERAEALAGNAMKLRSISVMDVLIPWDSVLRLDRALPDPELLEMVRDSRFSRLPIVAEGRVEGYVHQLEVLSAGPEAPVLGVVHSIPVLAPDTPVARALLELRGQAKRIAVVGTNEKPVGIVTLKDLVEEISGDLAGW